MSYHEGSNWQAKKEDEGKPLYESVPKPIQEKILATAANWNVDIEPHIARGMLKGYLMAKQELDDKDKEIERLRRLVKTAWDQALDNMIVDGGGDLSEYEDGEKPVFKSWETFIKQHNI